MKKIGIFMMMAIGLFSCTEKDQTIILEGEDVITTPTPAPINMEDFPQTWTLTRYSDPNVTTVILNGGSNSLPNQPLANIPLPDSTIYVNDPHHVNSPWGERYILNMDGTFMKERNDGTSIDTASGTFVYTDLSDGRYLELTYNTNAGMVWSCTAENIEWLKIKSENIAYGTWSACDLPESFYLRTE